MEKSATEVLEMLAENEESVEKLYSKYAEIFPRKKTFWLDLANEEANHARMIRRVVEQGVVVDQNSIPLLELEETLRCSLDYLAKKQTQAETAKLKMKEAVSTALEIETSMLERGNFDFLKGEISELNDLSYSLSCDTRKHSEKIRDELHKKSWIFF